MIGDDLMQVRRAAVLTLLTALHTIADVDLRGAPPEEAKRVTVERLPQGGIQPQVQLGRDGAVHLIYYSGNDHAGDVHYARRGPDEESFSEPMQVNSQSGSVIAAGTIRGAQLAIGGDAVIHVVWNGSQQAEPKGAKGEVPLLYARLGRDGRSFEPQRNLIASAYGLDGGACIAADARDHVFVAWHAGVGQEDLRRVWLVHSTDGGQTFGNERSVDSDEVGACGCCGMTGTVSPDGELMLLYRSAREDVHRDMYLLSSGDQGATVSSRKLHDWTIAACPMSSAAFVHGDGQSWAAWETANEVYLADVGSTTPITALQPAPGQGTRRKHPRMAVNARGELLLVWTEGTGWKKGGALAWQIYNKDGQPTLDDGTARDVPVWSFAAPYVRPDGTFVILY